MQNDNCIRCRVAACRESSGEGEGDQWNFYLLNDGNDSLDLVVLYEVTYEWGNWGDGEEADVRITDLSPGDHVLIWRDSGSGAELRMELLLRVRVYDREVQLQFEFPKLYRLSNLPLVVGLDKPGWQVVAEA